MQHTHCTVYQKRQKMKKKWVIMPVQVLAVTKGPPADSTPWCPFSDPSWSRSSWLASPCSCSNTCKLGTAPCARPQPEVGPFPCTTLEALGWLLSWFLSSEIHNGVVWKSSKTSSYIEIFTMIILLLIEKSLSSLGILLLFLLLLSLNLYSWDNYRCACFYPHCPILPSSYPIPGLHHTTVSIHR